MYEKTLENSDMSELGFASRMMKEVIAPPGSAASKKERLVLAARKLRWKYNRARAVWYGDERVQLKLVELREIEEVAGINYGKQELNRLSDIIAEADALLDGQDPHICRAFIRAMGVFIGALRRPRDGGAPKGMAALVAAVREAEDA